MVYRLICSRWLRSLAVVFAAVGGLSALCALAFAERAVAALPSNCSQSGGAVTCTFGYTGSAQVWIVPAGVTTAPPSTRSGRRAASRLG
jgi:hypothetical protein